MIDDKLHIPIQKDIGEYEQKLFGDMSIRTCVCLAGGFAPLSSSPWPRGSGSP